MYEFWEYYLWNRKKTFEILFELGLVNECILDRKWIKNVIYLRKNIIIPKNKIRLEIKEIKETKWNIRKNKHEWKNNW